MSVGGWAKPLSLTAGVGAAVGAAQLGIAYGLGVLLWAMRTEDPSGATWAANLTWICWLAATAVVVGSVAGGRVAELWGLPGSLLTRAAVMLSSAVGSLVTVPLVAIPARYVELAGDPTPASTAARIALLGVLLGAVVSIGVLLGRPLAWNVAATGAWLWLLALGSVLVYFGDEPLTVRLAIWSSRAAPGWLTVLVPMLATAVLLGAGIAYLAKRGGHNRVAVAVCGAPGPALIAVAYLIAGPGIRPEAGDQFLPYLAAPYAVLAGLLGSLLVAAIERPADDADGPAAEGAPAADGPVVPADDAAAGGVTAAGGTAVETGPVQQAVPTATDPGRESGRSVTPDEMDRTRIDRPGAYGATDLEGEPTTALRAEPTTAPRAEPITDLRAEPTALRAEPTTGLGTEPTAGGGADPTTDLSGMRDRSGTGSPTPSPFADLMPLTRSANPTSRYAEPDVGPEPEAGSTTQFDAPWAPEFDPAPTTQFDPMSTTTQFDAAPTSPFDGVPAPRRDAAPAPPFDSGSGSRFEATPGQSTTAGIGSPWSTEPRSPAKDEDSASTMALPAVPSDPPASTSPAPAPHRPRPSPRPTRSEPAADREPPGAGHDRESSPPEWPPPAFRREPSEAPRERSTPRKSSVDREPGEQHEWDDDEAWLQQIKGDDDDTRTFRPAPPPRSRKKWTLFSEDDEPYGDTDGDRR